MAFDWDIFVDEIKDGGKLVGLGALVLEAGVTEGLDGQLRRPKNQAIGGGTPVGELHWSALKDVEARVGQAWIEYFLGGPNMFFVLLRAASGESKKKACERLIEHLEADSRVPGGLDRASTTIHLDHDDGDPRGILRDLRRNFGILRAFKWDSKGSLLLQLSDILLGIAMAANDGSLDNLGATSSKAQLRKKTLLDHARSLRSAGKRNAVVLVDAKGAVKHLL